MAKFRVNRLRKRLLFVSGIVLLVIEVWWWQWQAPYRTLMTFLAALEKGDIDTIYALAPQAERESRIVTPDLIRKTYQYLLRPRLIERYQLVRIERTSPKGPKPEIWIRSVAVRFYLYYQDSKGDKIEPPLVVYVTRPPGDRKWRIPFSYYVYTTAHSLIGFDETQGDAWMYRVGYQFVYFHDGGVTPLKPPR